MKTHLYRRLLPLFLLSSTCVITGISQPVLAVQKDATGFLGGGYNDNVNDLPDGSTDKDGSLLGRATVSGTLAWAVNGGDKFYIKGLNSNTLYLTSGESSSILLEAAPGFHFLAMASRLDTDFGIRLSNNMSFEDSDPLDDSRTRNIRSTKPERGPTARESIATASGLPSTAFNSEFHASSLYDFGGFRAGGVIRLANTDYSRVPQEDTLTTIAARAIGDFSRDVKATFDFGFASNDSDLVGASYDGMLFSAALALDLSHGFNLAAGYGYRTREFDAPSDREDHQHLLHFALEKEIGSRRRLSVGYQRWTNDSNHNSAEYTANELVAGIIWNLL